jgi:methionyl-tRNA formyltransferase
MGGIRVKVLCVGYREWALKIFQELIGMDNIDISIIASRDDVRKAVIDSINPDVVLFYGWSWIVPKEIVISYLCFCLHPSKLPKYRGGSPIQNQIINGENESAVSIFVMTDKLDDGCIYFQKEFCLDGNIKYIFEKIYRVGLSGTIEILEKIKNSISLKLNIDRDEFYKAIDLKCFGPVEQDESKATFFNRLNPLQSEITVDELENRPSFWLYNKVRMLTDPYPNAYIVCKDGKKLFINSSYIED